MARPWPTAGRNRLRKQPDHHSDNGANWSQARPRCFLSIRYLIRSLQSKNIGFVFIFTFMYEKSKVQTV